jgi:hypothetical protein
MNTLILTLLFDFQLFKISTKKKSFFLESFADFFLSVYMFLIRISNTELAHWSATVKANAAGQIDDG